MKGFFDILHRWGNPLHGDVPFADIEMQFSKKDPGGITITGTGGIIVTSIKDGQVISESYLNPYKKGISIQSDANSPITIKGKVTELSTRELLSHLNKLSVSGNSLTSLDCHNCREMQELDLSECVSLVSLDCCFCTSLQELDLSKCASLVSLDCSFCSRLQELDLSANTEIVSLSCTSCNSIQKLDLSANAALVRIYCNSCHNLTQIDLSTNTKLARLNCNDCPNLQNLDLSANVAIAEVLCYDCTSLQELDLSTNTALTSLNCRGCTNLQKLDLSTNTRLISLDCYGITNVVTIKFRAIEQSASMSIAAAIQNAASTIGTVYLNSTDPYYNTVATYATSKGWTIEEL